MNLGRFDRDVEVGMGGDVSEPRRKGDPDGLLGSERLLLLDTCGAEATVALAEGDRLLAVRAMPGRSASERLMPEVAELLEGQGWRVQSLAAIAVVRGPGSFTGVRVGVSAAKALAEGTGSKLLALSRLEVLAAKGRVARTEIVVVLQAGREELFWSVWKGTVPKEQGVGSRTSVIAMARALDLGILCEESEALSGAAGAAGVTLFPMAPPCAGDALPLALERWHAGEFADPVLLDGLYLHRTEAETLERQQQHRLLKLGLAAEA